MFSDEETSNFDLEDLAKKYKLHLVGIYSKDELPKIQVGSYIVNSRFRQRIWIALVSYKNI